MSRSRIAALTAADALLASGAFAAKRQRRLPRDQGQRGPLRAPAHTNDFFELQMYSAGQNFLGGHHVRTLTAAGIGSATTPFPRTSPTARASAPSCRQHASRARLQLRRRRGRSRAGGAVCWNEGGLGPVASIASSWGSFTRPGADALSLPGRDQRARDSRRPVDPPQAQPRLRHRCSRRAMTRTTAPPTSSSAPRRRATTRRPDREALHTRRRRRSARRRKRRARASTAPPPPRRRSARRKRRSRRSGKVTHHANRRKADRSIATVCLFGALAAPAPAAHHLTKIRQIHPDDGVLGGDWVELQMPAAGENLVSGTTTIRTFNSTAAPAVAVRDRRRPRPPSRCPERAEPAHDPDQQPVHPSGVDADFVAPVDDLQMTGQDGAVCYTENNPPTYTPIDCVAYGAFTATGMIPSAGTPAVATPFESTLERSIAKGCATALDAADDTNNSSADFALSTRPPRNNTMAPTETLCPSPGGAARRRRSARRRRRRRRARPAPLRRRRRRSARRRRRRRSRDNELEGTI